MMAGSLMVEECLMAKSLMMAGSLMVEECLMAKSLMMAGSLMVEECLMMLVERPPQPRCAGVCWRHQHRLPSIFQRCRRNRPARWPQASRC